MKKHPKAKLLLNGQISYEYLQKYIRLANQHGIPFTIVENKEHETDIGLVLTYDYAIHKEEIYVEEKTKTSGHEETKKKTKTAKSLGFKGLLKKIKKR